MVDPLDGTINFLYSLPVMAVSVAAALDGDVVAGAVVDVIRDETFSAAAGWGARCDGIPSGDLRLLGTRRGAGADRILLSRRPPSTAKDGSSTRLLPVARDIRCFGSAALQLCWVGAGRADAYFERDIKVWDYAAGALIAREAGAVNELPCPENDGLAIAATPGIFDELRSLVEHAWPSPTADLRR